MTTGVIVFASCMDAERCPQQPVWAEVHKRKPDLLLLLGDQIYMDWGLTLRKVPRLKDEKRLDDFASAMHMRYSLQWKVPEFRALITDLVGRKGPGAVMLTWDDHDFAWNNAYGVDTPAVLAANEKKGATPVPEPLTSHDATVPPAFKRIAWRLRRQFVDVLQHPARYADGAYPDRPLVDDAAPAPALQRTALGRVPVLLLEERWYRSYRKQEGASMLGDAQMKALVEEITVGQGLLVVAGSSPLRHPYRLADQGWYTPEGAYEDLDLFLSAARESKRPVLYLAGDIHRNAYGGRIYVPAADGRAQASSVVQALSSGAALGRLLGHEFLPSYGVLRIEGTDTPNQCRVDLRLEALGGNPQHVKLEVKPQGAPPHKKTRGQWVERVTEGLVADMEGHRYLGETKDLAPLTVLCGRERQSDQRQADTLPLDIMGLDGTAFGDDPLSAAFDEPEAVSVQAQGDGKFLLLRTRYGNTDFDARLAERLQSAFERAKTGKRNVVLFIHGFNKTFAESLDQAYALRAVYPNAEPVLYSWPSGDAGDPDGLIQGLRLAAESTEAKKKARQEAARLGFALREFAQLCSQHHEKVKPPVILARSLGAMALAHAFPEAHTPLADALEKGQIRRVVLSAPALLPNDPPVWHKRMTVLGKAEVVVTVNADDRVLRYQNGSPLGAVWPPKLRRQGLYYVNFAGWEAVGEQHNYLLRPCGKEVDTFNRLLVEGESIDWTALGNRYLGGPED